MNVHGTMLEKVRAYLVARHQAGYISKIDYRWVPLHSTTTRALQQYAQRRDRDARSAGTDAFFVFDRGRSASIRNVEVYFRQLRQKLQWRARGAHPAPAFATFAIDLSPTNSHAGMQKASTSISAGSHCPPT